MRVRRFGVLAVFAGISVSLLSMPLRAIAASENPATAIVSSQVGSWDCSITSPGSKDAEQLVIVWSPYGENFIHGTVDVPAFGSRPGHKADFAFGYDARQKLWVSVYTDSLGAYSVSKSKAPANSRKMTFTDAYPVDPNNGPSTVDFGAQKSTIDSSWTEAGKHYTSHEACSKIPT